MIIKADCKHFPGDRPCRFNKELGIMCDDCPHYSPIKFKIIIIKLDAMGDVLRTTSILHSLKKKYPDSHITWLTKSNAVDIFQNNSLVDEVYTVENSSIVARLLTEKFDLLLHPDASPQSAGFASIINSNEKRGFILNSKGRVEPINPEAVEWFEMGAFDSFKKANQKTYQQIIHELLCLDNDKGEIILELSEKERTIRNSFIKQNSLEKYKFLIGINTGGSRRWKYKRWRLEGFLELINRLSKNKDIGILLYGGELESDDNKSLLKQNDNIFDTGTNNSLREFIALMDIPEVVLTGDTLALHIATALKKKIVCLFGPTSSSEIEDYGRIKKLSPEMDCLVCYKQDCDFSPNCMELISADMVYKELKSLL